MREGSLRAPHSALDTAKAKAATIPGNESAAVYAQIAIAEQLQLLVEHFTHPPRVTIEPQP